VELDEVVPGAFLVDDGGFDVVRGFDEGFVHIGTGAVDRRTEDATVGHCLPQLEDLWTAAQAHDGRDAVGDEQFQNRLLLIRWIAREMDVRVDQSRQQVFASAVDHRSARWRSDSLSRAQL
jgi:hypothetical protein